MEKRTYLEWIEICARFESTESERRDALDLGLGNCFDTVCHFFALSGL